MATRNIAKRIDPGRVRCPTVLVGKKGGQCTKEAGHPPVGCHWDLHESLSWLPDHMRDFCKDPECPWHGTTSQMKEPR